MYQPKLRKCEELLVVPISAQTIRRINWAQSRNPFAIGGGSAFFSKVAEIDLISKKYGKNKSKHDFKLMVLNTA